MMDRNHAKTCLLGSLADFVRVKSGRHAIAGESGKARRKMWRHFGERGNISTLRTQRPQGKTQPINVKERVSTRRAPHPLR